MAASRWMFTKEQLQNTPSRKNGIDADKELSYRQQAANLIQDMGQRLQVTQLCINTAIVFMHRFYMFRSFSRFPRNDMAPACLFLAAKVEEQPRKLEHVIKVAHSCLHRDRDNTPAPDPKSEAYLEQAQQLVINENILLQTLGFEVKVDHPHTHVVKATKLVNASKDLSQTSYYLATNSLHLTTFCLQHRPTVVACACIYLACKWAKYMIPRSSEGREWHHYVDQNVTNERIEEIYTEFVGILDRCPTLKLKKLKQGLKADEERRGKIDTSFKNTDHSMSPMPHHKHTNHERREGHHEAAGKHTHTDTKSNHEHRDSRSDHHRGDMHADKRGKDTQSSSHPDRKQVNQHHSDSKPTRKDERSRDSHSSQPHRKEAQTSSEQRERTSHPDNHKRDVIDSKRETDVNGRSHSSTSVIQSRSHPELLVKSEVNRDSPTTSGARLDALAALSAGSSSQSSTPSGTPEAPRKLKPETSTINLQEYMKRKKEKEIIEKERIEKEHKEKEMMVKQRRERELYLEKEQKNKEKNKERERALQQKIQMEKRQKMKQANAEALNKTFSESSSVKEQKHRPPKLDISLPLISDQKPVVNNRDGNERPYEVNIKSPIKPHHSITVKSPIKSSDLKHPKLEIPKVHITPEKDGSDSCSVNISDPAIRKLIGNVKQEAATEGNTEHISLTQVKVKQEHVSNSKSATPTVSRPPESDVKVKEEDKEELEPGEIEDEPEISLLPEHSAAPTARIRELGYDPEKGLDSAVSLKNSLKQELSSGRSTPVISQSGSESNTPLRMKIPLSSQGEASPLKIKISTKGLSTDSDHSSGKHNSPHRHKHKHKEKHKSHKHRDKERHKEKHREKLANSSSAGTNGQSLKMSFKLSDINTGSPGSGSGSSEAWAIKQKQDKHNKHKSSLSDPALNKNTNAVEPERQQPWSMSDLTKSATGTAHEDSPSRKRRRTPTVDQNSELLLQHKAQKMAANAIHRRRRSSSSHSVVSMEMSDGEEGQANGPSLQVAQDAQPGLSQLHESLHQLISRTQKTVEDLKQKGAVKSDQRHIKSVDRQQSGFDLDEMIWAGNSGDQPPLPPGQRGAPPLPPSLAPPPPPSH